MYFHGIIIYYIFLLNKKCVESGKSDATYNIALIGDSLIQRPCCNYDLLNLLLRNLKEYNIKFYDFAQGGRTIKQIVERQLEPAISVRPDIAVLVWDTDVSDVEDPEDTTNKEAYSLHLKYLIERFLNASVALALGGPGLMIEGPTLAPKRLRDKTGALEDYRNLNRYILSQYHNNFKSGLQAAIPYIDVRQALMNQMSSFWRTIGIFKCAETEDGEHPNRAGTQAIAIVISQVLRSLLTSLQLEKIHVIATSSPTPAPTSMPSTIQPTSSPTQLSLTPSLSPSVLSAVSTRTINFKPPLNWHSSKSTTHISYDEGHFISRSLGGIPSDLVPPPNLPQFCTDRNDDMVDNISSCAVFNVIFAVLFFCMLIPLFFLVIKLKIFDWLFRRIGGLIGSGRSLVRLSSNKGNETGVWNGRRTYEMVGIDTMAPYTVPLISEGAIDENASEQSKKHMEHVRHQLELQHQEEELRNPRRQRFADETNSQVGGYKSPELAVPAAATLAPRRNNASWSSPVFFSLPHQSQDWQQLHDSDEMTSEGPHANTISAAATSTLRRGPYNTQTSAEIIALSPLSVEMDDDDQIIDIKPFSMQL